MYVVYMIKNSFGDLYTGISENQTERLAYHNAGQGAKFTKREDVFRLVFTEQYATMAEARKREIQIKKWRRDKKEMLIKKYREGLPTKQ